GVVFDERGLHGMQRLTARDAFDRHDLGAVVAQRQREAGIDPPSVDQDGAGAALAAIAALLGAGEMQALAQEIEQRDARIFERHVAPYTVDSEADGESHARLRSGETRHIRRHPPVFKTKTGGIVRLLYILELRDEDHMG